MAGPHPLRTGFKMALKFKITEAEFKENEEAFTGLYEKSGDGYQLKVDGLPEPEDTSGLKRKIDELLNEKKEAKRLADEAEQRRLEAERKQAEEKNDFESLFQSSEKQRETLQKQLEEMRGNIAKKEVETTAMAIAGELAEGNNAKLLSQFVKSRLKYDGDGIQILDDSGKPTVATLDDLKKEFATSGMYDSLITGNKAGGGGANPNKAGGGAAEKTIARQDFEQLGHSERMEFVKGGGQVIDEAS